MTMTRADKEEITEVFTLALSNFKQIEKLERELISQQLDRIEEQVKKTNGTVIRHTEQLTKLEKELPHNITSCPQNNRVDELWNDRLTSKKIVKIVLGAASFTGVIVGVIFTIIKYFEK